MTSRVLLASLDTFWFPDIRVALDPVMESRLVSTWSGKQVNLGRPNDVNYHDLNLALKLFKRFGVLQTGYYIYDWLAFEFGRRLARICLEEDRALCVLSGCGLEAGRRFHDMGRPVVIECGSTHTDWQHRVVAEENHRNGLKLPLFPERYRNRVRQEFIEADWIQIPSTFVKKTFLEAGISESKLLMNVYGADITRFSPRWRDDLDRPLRVICPSGVNLRKGARILVEAWRKLGWRKEELHWIGSPRAPQAAHLFREPVEGIHWHGWMPREKLAETYRECDVLVLPSFEEGFARVLVEGAASGLALVATPNTGVEDFFTPEDPEGWLIPVNSVDALCQALEQAKSDRERTRQLGLRAAAKAKNGFSREDYVKRVRENFKKVLGKDA